MLNKMAAFLGRYNMVSPGDTVICAVSGGADSVALLFGFYLLKDKLGIRLEAAHFNHQLRGAESDRDEAFVREFCDRYDIPLHLGTAPVRSGKKGLEAAARDARYGFLRSLNGKIATAHTADDNAETVLLHLVRGTGLKGLGGITPVSGNVIRPMLSVTRQEVEEFLDEWCLNHIQDSSNNTDAFLRNRLRRHVMPLLRQENPRIGENLSRMALNLRQEEDCLAGQTALLGQTPTVTALRDAHPAIRRRYLADFLVGSDVKEPEDAHISLAESLVFSENPSARADFPGGVVITRRYDALEAVKEIAAPEEAILPCPGEVLYGGYRVTCAPAEALTNGPDAFTVSPVGQIRLRPRKSGDSIRLSGGTKSLKKLFIDRKIPADLRHLVPVVCDEQGILGVYSLGADQNRTAGALPAMTIRIYPL